MIRSILEGVAFEAQQIIEASETTGAQVKSVIMVGGGSKSDIWRQIVADVTNRPVRSPDQSETAALGAGILAGLGGDVFEGVAKAPQTSAYSENEPDPDAHEIYGALYRKFKVLYESSRAVPVAQETA
jgi:xylulokinase